MATQKIKNDWKNKLSIYYYSLTEFKHLIRSLEKSKDDLNIYDNFIHTNFREGWRLKRDEFFNTLTYGDLKKDDKKIEETYQKLKDSLPPIKDQSTSLVDLELPFDMNKKAREKALKERLKQVYKIEEDSFIYKRFDRYYESPNSSDNNNDSIQFPYKVVKGKGSVTIVEDPTISVSEGEKISMKYLGTLDHPIAKMITEHSKKGENVLIEISPKFFSTWDYGKE